jgi:hypothetical protein|tara:strand:- start:24 stop:143 length:120 start_codon:yes stop_codon:yes gene_type:complete
MSAIARIVLGFFAYHDLTASLQLRLIFFIAIDKNIYLDY